MIDPKNIDAAVVIDWVKENILSLVIVIAAMIIAVNIYKGKADSLASLKTNIGSETEKNKVLGDIALLEKNVIFLKNKVNTKSGKSIMETFNAIIEQAGVKGGSTKVLDEINYPAYTKCPFELVVYADTFHKLGKLISLLESSPDIFWVESVSVTSNPAQQAQGNRITARLIVSTAAVKN